MTPFEPTTSKTLRNIVDNDKTKIPNTIVCAATISMIISMSFI